MDKGIAKKWRAALRSGKYKQAKGVLRTEDNEFCCLGVLCNLHAEAHPEFAATQTNPLEYSGECFYLPSCVLDWAGLTQKQANRFAIANDDHHKTFQQIAKMIK